MHWPLPVSLALGALCAPLLAAEPTEFPSQVNGVVRTDTNELLPNITVEAISFVNDRIVRFSTITDVQGRFTFQLPDGNWSIGAPPASLNALGLIAPPTLLRSLNSATNSANLVVPTPTASLSGVVRDDAGSPVPNILVIA